MRILFALLAALIPALALAQEPPNNGAPQVVSTEKWDAGLRPGDVFVPRAERDRNRNGNCTWCAAETCFWGAAKLEKFKGLTDRAVKEGWHGASIQNILAYCKAAGVEAETGSGAEFVKHAVAKGCGAAIHIPGHFVYCCGIDDESARIIDNGRSQEVQVWSRAKFDSSMIAAVCPTLDKLFKPRVPRPNPNHPSLPPVTPGPVTPGPVTPPVTPAPAVDLKPILDKLAEIEAKLAAVESKPGKDGVNGRDGKDGKDGTVAQIDYERLAIEVAKRLPPPATVNIDYDRLTSEVVKRLPPHADLGPLIVRINNIQEQLQKLQQPATQVEPEKQYLILPRFQQKRE